MADERVEKILEKQEVPYKICDFERAFTSTEDARELLDIPMKNIAKTLAYRSQFGAIMIIISGEDTIDPDRYKKKFGIKQYVLDKDELMEFTGYEPGSVSPIGITNKKVKIYMDRGLKECGEDFVYPSGGTPNSAIGIRSEHLFKVAGCQAWIDVKKRR